MKNSTTNQQNYNSINDETETAHQPPSASAPVTFHYITVEPTSCSLCCTRSLFIFINFIILLISLSLIVIGGFGIFYFDSVFALTNNEGLYIPIIFIIIGSFLSGISIIACFCNPKHNFCGLYTYSFFQFICFLTIIASTATFFTQVTPIENSFKNGFANAVKNYTAYKSEVDYIQRLLQCCGSINYTDYFTKSTYEVPTSCCQVAVYDCRTTFLYPDQPNNDIFQQGCSQPINKFINDDYIVIALIGALFSLVPFFAAVTSCCMLYSARRSNMRADYQRL